MLSIATRLLTPGSSYRLQVDYDGGQTGILSLPTQMKLSLKGIMKATGMEGMQAEIHLIPSFSRLLNIPTIRMMVLQTGPPRKPSRPPATNGGGTDSDDSEKTPPVSGENDPADHKPSLPDGKDDSDEPAIPEIEAPVYRSARGRYRFAAAPEALTTPRACRTRSCLEAFRKRERSGTKHDDRSPGKSQIPKTLFFQSSLMKPLTGFPARAF